MKDKLNIRLCTRCIQATRTTPAIPQKGWELETPNGWVYCKNLDEARDLADAYESEILL